MALCKLSRNLLKSDTCGYSLMNITDLYLANYEDVIPSGNTIDVDSAGCETVSAITLASGAKWYRIMPAKGSTTFTDELVVADNGAKYRTHTITFTINGEYTGCLHIDFDDLSLGRFLVVAKTGSGNYIALGRQVGLEATAATLTGSDDTNGMEITLSANTAESSVPLSEAAVTALLANVAE